MWFSFWRKQKKNKKKKKKKRVKLINSEDLISLVAIVYKNRHFFWGLPAHYPHRVCVWGGGGGGGGWGGALTIKKGRGVLSGGGMHLLSKRVGCAVRSPGPLPLSRHEWDPFPDKSKTNIYHIVYKKYMLICLGFTCILSILSTTRITQYQVN